MRSLYNLAGVVEKKKIRECRIKAWQYVRAKLHALRSPDLLL